MQYHSLFNVDIHFQLHIRKGPICGSMSLFAFKLKFHKRHQFFLFLYHETWNKGRQTISKLPVIVFISLRLLKKQRAALALLSPKLFISFATAI